MYNKEDRDREIKEICMHLALLETFKKLNDKYQNTPLTKGQIYRFYQENFDYESYIEIVKSALAEELP